MLLSSLSFYAQPGQMSGAKELAHLLQDIPTEIPELVSLVQGLAVHIFWAERYGLNLSEERKSEVNLRPLYPKLRRLLELDPAPLRQARPLERRLVCNCRDFSLLAASLLRHKGIPARARCGFGTYFMPGHFEDHWVCQYWHASQARWVMVDFQLDALQQQVLQPDFDPLDMPPGKFVLAGHAWQMCRADQADPDTFGIFQWHGWDFIRGNVIRDLLSLNKIEILPWDFWPGFGPELNTAGESEWVFWDRVAELTLQADAHFKELRDFYQTTPRLHVPAEWLE